MLVMSSSSITAPQDACKFVLLVAEWLTASLSGLARHKLACKIIIVYHQWKNYVFVTIKTL